MSESPDHSPSDSPSDGPSDSPQSNHGLAQVVLVGAILQILASVSLSLARIDHLETAAAEGPGYYVISTLIALVSVIAVWALRRRTAIALPLLLGWPVIVYLTLGRHLSILGLAYHGEFILYHFLSLSCAALCIVVPLRWSRDASLGKIRFAPLALGGAGALALAFVHLGAIPGLRMGGADRLAMIGGTALLAAWPAALFLLWRKPSPLKFKIAATILMAPIGLRVLLTGPEGLMGAPVPEHLVLYLGICIFVVAAAVSFLFRPRVELWARLMISGLCLGTTLFFWLLYDRGFGELEDGFDGLIRSFLGFPLPYPAYVSEWKLMGMMMAVFFILSTVYTALVSTEDRYRGVPLAILALAGIGLTSPHLLLMCGAGALLLVDTLMLPQPESSGPSAGRGRTNAKSKAGGEDGEPIAVEDIARETAKRLGFDPPVGVNEGRARLLMLSGELGPVGVDLRARQKRERWSMELTVGVPGRTSPSLELVPDTSSRGTRPAHTLAKTHRLVGTPRALEQYGDQIMDAMSRFERAHLRLWPGGCAIDVGDELGRLDADGLEALIRASARII